MRIELEVNQLDQDTKSLNPNKDKNYLDKSDMLETVSDAVYGAANQWNVLPNYAGLLTALGTPFGADLPNKENLSFMEKFREGKRIAQENINKKEDRSPIATTIGNAAGGIGLNFLGLPTGAGAVNKGLQALNKGKDLSKGLKVAGDIVGTGLEGASQGYAFSRDEDSTKDALIGAGLGSGLSAGGKLLAKGFKELAPKATRVLTGTPKKQAELYAERVGEIKKQKINDPTPIQSFEDDLSTKITTDKTNYQNDMSKFFNELSDDAKKVNLERQQIESNIFDELVDARKTVQDEISKEAGIGYDILKDNKMVDINPVLQVIEDAFYKVDPNVDPSVAELEKFYNRLRSVKELNNGQLSELGLKRYLTSVSHVAYKDADKVGYTPYSIRLLRNVANESRDILNKSNPEYAKQAKKITDTIRKLDDVEEILDFNNGEKTLNRLKNVDFNLKTQKALKLFDEIFNGKFGEKIKKSNSINQNLDSDLFTKNAGDWELDIPSMRNGSAKLQSFENTLKNFDKINKTKYAEKFKELRTKHNIDDVEKFEGLLKDNKGLTRFRKDIEGLDIEDTKKPQTAGEKLIEGDNSAEFNRKALKDQASRKLIEKVSKYLGKDSKDVIRKFENEKLISGLDKGDPNGSKNVNLGSQLGKGLSSILGIPSEILGAIGGLLGFSKDKGGLSRAYKGIVNFLDDVEKANANGGNLKLDTLENIPLASPLVRSGRAISNSIGSALEKPNFMKNNFISNKLKSDTVDLNNLVPLMEGRVAPIYTMEDERQDQYFRNRSGVKRQQNLNKQYFDRDPN